MILTTFWHFLCKPSFWVQKMKSGILFVNFQMHKTIIFCNILEFWSLLMSSISYNTVNVQQPYSLELHKSLQDKVNLVDCALKMHDGNAIIAVSLTKCQVTRKNIGDQLMFSYTANSIYVTAIYVTAIFNHLTPRWDICCFILRLYIRTIDIPWYLAVRR